MDKKILLQELADSLVSRRGLSKKDAEQFVRTVFDVISQYLEADKQVKIKGLGTFKIVQVNSRESVNVNTGERFRIDGHAKVTFVPDAVLKDEVNKPFLQFETVVINDSTPISEMERMDKPAEFVERDEEETADVTVVEEELPVTEGEDEQKEKTKVEEEMSDGEREEVSEDLEEEPAVTAEPEMLPDEGEEMLFQKENASMPLSEETPLPDEEETAVPVSEEEPAVPENTSMSVEHLQADYQRVESQRVEDLNVTSQRVEHQTIENQHIVQPEKTDGGGRGMRITPWGMVGLFLLVILLMLGSYYAGYYGLLCPRCLVEQVIPSRTETQTKAKVPAKGKKKVVPKKADSVAVAKDTVAVTPPVKKSVAVQKKEPEKAPVGEKAEGQEYAQVPGGKYLIVGTRKTIQIRPGQTLRGIALEEYGSKGYFSYIIVHNGIVNPDKVEAGKMLKLPELKLRAQ